MEARSFGREGGQVVTQLLPGLHVAAWYVPSAETESPFRAAGLKLFASTDLNPGRQPKLTASI